MNLPVPAPTQPLAAEPSRGDQYLAFRSRGLDLALPIAGVREIIEYGPLTEVPRMPASVRGVINLRGNVVSVLDLGARLQGQRSEIQRRSCIVVMELPLAGELRPMGLLVDAVDAVFDLDAHAIEPPPSFGTRIDGDCIAGLARRGAGFTAILKPDQLLAADLVAAPTSEADCAPLALGHEG